jgi:hypothetical protein
MEAHIGTGIIEQYHFDIVHRSGTLQGNCDAIKISIQI